MKWFKNLKLEKKIIITIVMVLLISFVTMISIILRGLFYNSLENAEMLVDETSKHYARKVEEQLIILKTTAESMVLNVEALRINSKAYREVVIEAQKKFMVNNPSIFGIAVAYEPNMFDGRDNEYVSKQGYGSNGEFIPYVSRSSDGLVLEAAYNEETNMAWYNVPKQTKKTYLTEPTVYKINGKDVLMTSIVVPIIDNSKFLGVVSVDYTLDEFQSMIEKVKPYGGYASVITNKGTIVAHGTKTELLTKNITEYDKFPGLVENVNSGKEFKYYDIARGTNVLALKAFQPIHLEGTNEYWSFISVVPRDNVLAGYNQIKGIIITVSIVVIILVLIVLGFLMRKLVISPIRKAVQIIEEMSKGHFKSRLNIDTNDEIGIMAKSMNEFMDNLQNNVINVMKHIADGDIDVQVKVVDEDDEIGPALKKTIETLKQLIDQINILINSAVNGELNTRGDSTKFKGSYSEIIIGINNTLDAIIGPLNVASEYVENISKGYLPPKITETYYGDFNKIKNNLNTCIDAINALVNDTNTLINAAIDGKLDARIDVSRHSGDFASIIDGMNKTLDAVIEPVKEASQVLGEMAKGNLQTRVEGAYRGDHAEIKDALNYTLSSITGYIDEISTVLTEMSNGNLDVSITGEYNGDFNQIKKSINLIIESFNEILSEFNAAADQVASGSRHVSDSSQALSQGSAEQASAIQEITASITQIANQTKQNAVNANQANELAIMSKENAVQGNEQMKEMLKAMGEINISSQNISKIIKVIDEIAFQTNILALNAAVEAARAGQHGKGFAVVAEEVRNLAARSANAAKETTDLIEGSVKKVESGTEIANQTAEALNRIVEGIAKASNIVSDIAVASNEQATGIAQMNQGIAQVSQVTQSNTATAEESASASEQLASQADVLKSMIKRFKLKDDAQNLSKLTSVEKQKTTSNRLNTSTSKGKQANSSQKVKIVLDDNEFGKY